MNNVARVLAPGLFVVCAASVSAQSWPAPSPQVFASVSGTYGFKTQPSQSNDCRPGLPESALGAARRRCDVFGMSQGMLFTLAPDGTEAVVWKGFLLNVPHRAIVTDDGKYVVTLDVWARLGYERCLVIYDEHGIVVASFDLEALLSKEEITKFVFQADGSREWLRGGKVEFNDRSDRVVVTLSWGKVISIVLADGKIDAA
jgi:hypothetical protein